MATVSPAYLVAAVRTWDTAVRTGSRSAKKRLYRQAVNQCKLLVNTSFPFFHRLCSPTLPLPCCHASSAPHVPFWRHAGLPTLPPCPPSPGSENTCLGNNQACPCCDPRLPPAMLLPFIDSGGGGCWCWLGGVTPWVQVSDGVLPCNNAALWLCLVWCVVHVYVLHVKKMIAMVRIQLILYHVLYHVYKSWYADHVHVLHV